MAPIDRSQSDLPEKIQANLIAYMRLFAGLPGVVIEDDQAFWFVSGKPAPGNNILRARWPDEGIEARLDALYARIGQHIAEIEWLLFPCDRPADLGKRLEQRGMLPQQAGNWLWADLTRRVPGPSVPEGFRIEPVRDDQAMAEWLKATDAGFGGDHPLFYTAYARHGYGPDADSLHYIGYLGDRPVTSGTLLDAGGTAAIYDVSTPPEYRRRGFGGALTAALIEEIRRRGYTETWIWSSDMAQGVYQKLGFVAADFGIRAYVWRK